MREIERRLVKKEVLRSPEKWIAGFSVVTISGPSGVGKTTIAEELARRYGIPEERNIKTGQLLRKRTGEEKAVGYIQRPLLVDKELDRMQEEKIIDATLDQPIILEGRLAGLIATEARMKGRIKFPIATFLLTADSRVRHKRIWKRWLEDHPDDYKTLQQIKYLTQEREMLDRHNWLKVHPELIEGDPFLPGNIDREGNKIYDEVISTTHLSVEDAEERIHRFLKNRGLVRKV